MIDGQLAFPDEEPAADWQDLRVGTSSGMVTLRREPDGIRLVIWGNADAGMRQAWNAVTWAVAMLSGGCVESADQTRTPEEFAHIAELPPGFTAGS